MNSDDQANALRALTRLESWVAYTKRQVSGGHLNRTTHSIGVDFMRMVEAGTNQLLHHVENDRVQSPASPDPISDEEVCDTDDDDDLPPLPFNLSHADPPPPFDLSHADSIIISDDEDEILPRCEICYTELYHQPTVTMDPCRHTFHQDCNEVWLTGHDYCALCRTPVDSIDYD